MSLLRKKRVQVVDETIFTPPKAELVSFNQLTSASDEVLTRLAGELKKGIPLILNFEKIEIDEANKAMAFFSGVVFAIDGEIFSFKDGKSFMFADKTVYDDGSIKQLIAQIQEN